MRVLVLGGSVFLGRAVVEEALARGDDVTTFTRGRTGSIPAGAHSVVGDRAADNGLRGLGDGSWDVVVDVTRSPTQISRAIAQLGDRIGHYVFISTVSVYASFAEGPLDEGSPVSPASGPADDEADPAHYGPLKVHCEELVRGAFGDHALVIRPGLIVGPGDPSDRFTYWVERGTRGGSVLAPGDPNTPARYLDVRDLATWIRLAAANNLTGTFNAVGPGRPTSMGEVIERCIDIGGGGAAPVWVTDAFLDEQDVTSLRTASSRSGCPTARPTATSRT
jgi:2'-hydroxyisoflavone reductase